MRELSEVETVGVVGAGTMGNGIAQVAAASGYDVTCMDVMPAALEKAKAAYDNNSIGIGQRSALLTSLSDGFRPLSGAAHPRETQKPGGRRLVLQNEESIPLAGTTRAACW